ncbi:hypothetical protein CBS9595_004343 [Malassezia furfur]|nr:hypothetical protein CBS9595_004343 [Malassezia furfur]
MTSWVPLEANPELFGAWSAQLGLDTQQSTFHDIFGLDEELLAMVPQPVHAVLCLLPLTPNIEARHRSEDAAYTPPQGADKVLWFEQTIGNACGTIGLLHAIANSPAAESMAPDSPLAQLLRVARGATPAERTKLLESSDALKSAHAATAGQGQTAAPDADDPVNLHFVAFVRGPDGKLWELDGRRRGPIARDVPVDSEAALLPSAAKFVQDYYMRTDPDQVQFNLIALGPAA